LKNIRSVTVQGMKFPNAPHSLKMACGENPKRVYGNRNTEPSTRMGNVAGYRKAWIEAQSYLNRLEEYESKSEDAKELGYAPSRDLELETLVGVLKGEILIQNHCYRGEEMAIMLDIAKEFSYKVTTFHHAIEAYKVADILAEQGVCAAMWADWWGFKHEAFDMVWENVAMVDQALIKLTNASDIKVAWKGLVLPNDIVAIKVNPLAAAGTPEGQKLSTHPIIVDRIVEGLYSAGVLATQVIVWDRFSKHLIGLSTTRSQESCPNNFGWVRHINQITFFDALFLARPASINAVPASTPSHTTLTSHRPYLPLPSSL